MIEVLQVALAVGLPVGGAVFCFVTWLNRLHPPHKPDPSGKELLARQEEHEKQVKREIEVLAGRLSLREARPRLRE